MKSIYLWIVAAVMAFGIFPVQADNVQFSVIISNPEALTCNVGWDSYTLVKGENKFDVAEYTTVAFSTTSQEYVIEGLTNSKGTALTTFPNYCSITPTTEIQDEVFTLKVTNINDFRTSSFTLNVDDPSMVNAVVSGYYTQLTLEKGENIVKYDPAKEVSITISPTNYTLPIYSVKKNGVPVADNYGQYELAIEEDMVVDVQSQFPDEDATVTFTYTEGAEGSVSIKLDMYGDPVDGFDGKTYTAKLGTNLYIVGDYTMYKFNGITVNGKDENFYGTYNLMLKGDTKIHVDATPYGTLAVTINVTDPDLITIYDGYENDNKPFELQAGENIVNVGERNPYISWKVSKNGILKSVELNGEPTPGYGTSVMVKEGDVMNFEVIEKDYNLQAAVWIDNSKAKTCSMYLEMRSANEYDETYTFPASGYGLLAFYESLNPFRIGWFGQDPDDPYANVSLNGKVYLNDELLSPLYEGSTQYQITLENNDVVKFFMDSTPEECDVTIDLAENAEATVVKDIVTVVENPADGFTCFNGTQVTISGNVKVAVNGKDLDPDASQTPEENEVALFADGVPSYTFVVEENTTVAVTAANGTGIDTVDGVNNANADVFNSLGVKVGNSSDLKSLAPGIYIVKGKKVAVGR